LFAHFSASSQYRIHKSRSLKRPKIADFLTNADQFDRKSDFIGDPDRNAAFGGTIKLRQNDSVDHQRAGVSVELNASFVSAAKLGDEVDIPEELK
jgi:hypothetical protein